MNGDATPQRLVLLDGHGIIYRAYFGNRDNPLSVRRTGYPPRTIGPATRG